MVDQRCQSEGLNEYSWEWSRVVSNGQSQSPWRQSWTKFFWGGKRFPSRHILSCVRAEVFQCGTGVFFLCVNNCHKKKYFFLSSTSSVCSGASGGSSTPTTQLSSSSSSNNNPQFPPHPPNLKSFSHVLPNTPSLLLTSINPPVSSGGYKASPAPVISSPQLLQTSLAGEFHDALVFEVEKIGWNMDLELDSWFESIIPKPHSQLRIQDAVLLTVGTLHLTQTEHMNASTS